MLTETDLKELLGYQAKHPVLSVYLNTEPAEGSADAYKLRLRTMLKEVNLPDDVKAIEHFFAHEYDWIGRSIAVFSCAPEGFLRAYALALPVSGRVLIGDNPHVKPLADLLDDFGGYGVALVDKQGARLFYFNLGELREQEGMMGEAIRHTKRGGASTFPGRRGGIAGVTNYVDGVTERNMKDLAEFAARFFSENNVRRVLIGGTDDNVALFRSHLPKAWQSLIVGAFPMSMTASAKEVHDRAMQIGLEARHRRELQLIDAIVTASAKGHGGAMGLGPTLGAVHDGRIMTLAIRDGYAAPGYRCTGCGSVATQAADKCPFCNSVYEKIPDVVEMAVRKVMQQGGEVEVLHDGQIAAKRGQFEDIGALLRY